MPIRMASCRVRPACGERADVASHQCRIHAELGLHELGAGRDLAAEARRLPIGGRIDRQVGGAKEEGGLARNLAAGWQFAFIAQPPRGLKQRF